MKKALLLSFIAAFGFSASSTAQNTITVGSTTLTEEIIATGVQVPWEILWGPDDHIWATERRGRILRIDPSNGNITTLLNHESAVLSQSERGMLGMCLHPDFNNTPTLFVAYCYSSGGVKVRLSSFDYNEANQTLTNEQFLINNIPGGSIHDGARLMITEDNKILMSMGDIGQTSLPQNMNSMNGKFLRVNLDGSIPSDNPDSNSYVYSFGHRNPQGLCQGPNGIIYSSEHGAQNSDELNVIEANRNYGWPTVQGACNTANEITYCNNNNVREPLAEWSPCEAVNGIEYYNHPAIPEWQNSVIMAILGGLGGQWESLAILHLSGDGLSVTSEDNYFTQGSSINYGRLRDVCVNPHNGAVYIATNGPSYPGSGPNQIVSYRNLAYSAIGIEESENNNQFIKLSPNPMIENMTIEFSENFLGSNYEIISYAGQIVMNDQINGRVLNLNKGELAAGSYYLRASNNEGTITRAFVVK